jgi:energy-coupling factor transporter ATP-binding protein EcfA2
VLISYAENTEHYEIMKELADDIKFFLPIEKESIKEIDKKVFNVLGDLKILLYTNRDPYRVEGKIKELDKLIDERNSKI